jgi:hypothetical protein
MDTRLEDGFDIVWPYLTRLTAAEMLLWGQDMWVAGLIARRPLNAIAAVEALEDAGIVVTADTFADHWRPLSNRWPSLHKPRRIETGSSE